MGVPFKIYIYRCFYNLGLKLRTFSKAHTIFLKETNENFIITL